MTYFVQGGIAAYDKFLGALPAADLSVIKDAATLARTLLEMSIDEFRIAFKGSPMKRAKLSGLQRNAAVLLGNIDT